MTDECATAWAFFHKYDLRPVSTQDAVALGACGTRVDVVAVSGEDNVHTVLEVKRGCGKNFSNGQRWRAPFASRAVSTHDHYVLQTLVADRMYRAKHPDRAFAAPWLIRCDGRDLYAYAPPAWALQGLPSLLAAVAAK